MQLAFSSLLNPEGYSWLGSSKMVLQRINLSVKHWLDIQFPWRWKGQCGAVKVPPPSTETSRSLSCHVSSHLKVWSGDSWPFPPSWAYHRSMLLDGVLKDWHFQSNNWITANVWNISHTMPAAKSYSLCDSRIIRHSVDYIIKMNLF